MQSSCVIYETGGMKENPVYSRNGDRADEMLRGSRRGGESQHASECDLLFPSRSLELNHSPGNGPSFHHLTCLTIYRVCVRIDKQHTATEPAESKTIFVPRLYPRTKEVTRHCAGLSYNNGLRWCPTIVGSELRSWGDPISDAPSANTTSNTANGPNVA
jgi:hypothetical protein